MNAPVLPTRLVQPVALPLGAFTERAGALTAGLREAEREDYVDAANGIEVGVWEGTPGQFPARRDGYSEICQILSGIAVLHTEGGAAIELRAGDTIVMPTGWTGRWELIEPVRKLYIIVHDRP
jgi:uncharacterized cupin superfamily protein